MKQQIKGIIFDLDGVICFTDIYHYNAWKEMADGEGIEFDLKINDRLKGVSRAESLEIILEKASREYTPQEKADLMELKNHIYREQLKTMTPADLSEEVRNTLDALRAKGLKLAIGSSSKNAKFILERIGLIDFFDAISDGTNIQRSKPDPQVFLMAAQMLQLNPEECLVVEDAEAGIDAAEAGHFHRAGIGSARDYAKTEYRLDSFQDLLNIPLES
ncbi:MAG: beta-phosphoglucomutase [Parasporobacterium sp.]|nr:beta-phosphoglucomutase [Parasporobacterium sp.]